MRIISTQNNLSWCFIIVVSRFCLFKNKTLTIYTGWYSDLLCLFVIRFYQIFRQRMKKIHHWIWAGNVRRAVNYRLEKKWVMFNVPLVIFTVFQSLHSPLIPRALCSRGWTRIGLTLRNSWTAGILLSALARFLIVNLSENDFSVEENENDISSFTENKYSNRFFSQPHNVKKHSNYFWEVFQHLVHLCALWGSPLSLTAFPAN